MTATYRNVYTASGCFFLKEQNRRKTKTILTFLWHTFWYFWRRWWLENLLDDAHSFRFSFKIYIFFNSTFTAFYIQQTYTYNSKIYISIELIDDNSYLYVRANIQNICDIYIVLVVPFFNSDRFWITFYQLSYIMCESWFLLRIE